MKELINKYKEKYKGYELEIDSIENIVYRLISYITHKDISEIRLNKSEISLTKTKLKLLDKYITKVIEEKYPIQYITGKVYIYNEDYIVTKDVLIPRQDTETLIEESIKCINENNLKALLDICTGSGVVGISISKNSNIEKCMLADISGKALKVCKKNIALNNASKCKIIESDMFKSIKENKFDIIVSNPPYIKEKDMENLSEYVKKEPSIALYGGKSGVIYYDRIYKEALNYLNDNGYILVEIGYDEDIQVVEIISEYKEYLDIEIIKDINGKSRVIKCRFHKI